MELKLKKLFEEKNIEVLIGYEKASQPYRLTPCFIKSPEELDRLVIGPFMGANLVHYLNEVNGKVAVLVKSCDVPSVIALFQENRISHENIVLVGVACPGFLELEKITAKLGFGVEKVEKIDLNKDRVVVKIKAEDQSRELSLSDVLADKCLSCAQPIPSDKMVDILIGNHGTAKQIPVVPDPAAKKIAALEKMSPEERWAFWKKELQRCIRCYACKNACPVCYCTRCMVEIDNPQWVSPANVWQDNVIYQLMRINHVAGRCTNCGECARVCPVGIPLNLLTGKLFKLIADNFNHIPGEDPEAKPPLTCFRQDDPENFIY